MAYFQLLQSTTIYWTTVNVLEQDRIKTRSNDQIKKTLTLALPISKWNSPISAAVMGSEREEKTERVEETSYS